MKQTLLIILLCSLSLSGLASGPCEDEGRMDQNLLSIAGNPAVHLSFEPETIQTGELFTVRVVLCDPSLELLEVDAGMPAHGHGMNYRPVISMVEDNVVTAEGFLFHMPGHWEISLALQDGSSRVKLVREIELAP